MKKIIVILITIIFLISSTGFVFAFDKERFQGKGETLRYYSIVKAEYGLGVNGRKLKPNIYITPKSGKKVDNIIMEGKLVNAENQRIIKTWRKKVYPDSLGDFIWRDSQRVPTGGNYYFRAEIECYKGGNLLETIEGESLQVEVI